MSRVKVNDKRRLPFIMVTKAALTTIRERFDKRRAQTAMSVYIGIVECANDARSDSFELSRKDVAERAMVHIDALRTYVRELKDAGLIEVDNQDDNGRPSGLPTIWTLTDPPSPLGVSEDGSQGLGPAPNPLSSEGLGPASKGGLGPAPNPLNREPKERKKEKPPLPDGKGASPHENGLPPSVRSRVERVFDEWVCATERDAKKTVLTGERFRLIEKALVSHGAEACLKAVRNIGHDPWARGANNRKRRFDDIKHALGNAERIERWRDWTPDDGADRRSRRSDALRKVVEEGEGE